MILDLCAVTCAVAFVFMTLVVIRDSQKNEVKHGRWEDVGHDWFDLWKCSVCGTEWNFAYDPTSTDTRVNYCPDCGARMDDEE